MVWRRLRIHEASVIFLLSTSVLQPFDVLTSPETFAINLEILRGYLCYECLWSPIESICFASCKNEISHFFLSCKNRGHGAE